MFVVCIADSPSADLFVVILCTCQGAATSTELCQLIPGVPYRLRLRAENEIGKVYLSELNHVIAPTKRYAPTATSCRN